MTHRTTKIFCLALLAAPCVLAVTPGPSSTNNPDDKLAALFGDPVIAKGKGVEIKRSQLDSALISIKASAAARGQGMSPEQSQLLEQQLLQRLIQIQLLLDRATDADKAKGKEVADKQYEVILKRAGSEEAIARQLKSVDMTPDELHRKMVQEATAAAVAERELKVTVTDAEVKKFYEDNPARFEQPEMVRVSHILLSTLDPITRQPLPAEKKAAKRKQADDLLKRARAGEDFGKLVKDFSEDPVSKDKGGEIGPFPRGAMPQAPEFESAAFSLNTNQISDIVTSPFGYHILKLDEKIPAQKVELAKVQDRLKEGLKQQELEKKLPDYMEQLKKEAGVEILDEKLKPSPTPGLNFNAPSGPTVAPGTNTDLLNKPKK